MKVYLKIFGKPMIGEVKPGCGVDNLGYGVANCLAHLPAARIAGSILGREAWYTDKIENKIFLIYKEIQRDRVKSHI